MTTWPPSIWTVLLTLVPFLIVYVIVTVIVFARVHPNRRVSIRFKRPTLKNGREGLEWKIPGLVLGITWYLLITYIPLRFFGWFGIDISFFAISSVPLSPGQCIKLQRASLTDLVLDGALAAAMVVAGALVSSWIHNRRIQDPAPE